MTPWQALLLIVFPAIAGLAVGRHKGYWLAGLLAGLLLSWLGVLMVAVWRPSPRELIRRERARLEAEAQARKEAAL